MEVFRTDGGGKTFSNEILTKLVELTECYSVCSLEEIIKINDHKGPLNVYLNTDENSFYWFYFFKTFWAFLHDYWVVVYVNNEIKHDSYTL